MIRIAVGVTLAAALILTGWMAGKAQTAEPDFEIVVETTLGDSAETTIKCVKGCGLSWVERGVNPNASVMPQFTFKCTPSQSCPSGRVGGWLRR
jgi:hypothetical protein